MDDMRENMENQIIVYQPNETMRLDVRVENETVWLNQSRLGELFGVDRTVVNRHINNIYKTGELDASPTCAKIAQVQEKGGWMVRHTIPLHRLTRRRGGTVSPSAQAVCFLTQRTRREAQRARVPWRPLRQRLCDLCVEMSDAIARLQVVTLGACPRFGTVAKSKEKSKERILAALASRPEWTTADLVRETGLSRSGIERNLRLLKAEGRLRRKGADNGGNWQVIEKSNEAN